MDDDLDDLFGEGPSLQLPVALPKGLLYRVDELCSAGCRQKLAWSRIGCVAHVTEDNHGVALQSLFCDPRDGQWNLSKQYSIDDVRSVHGLNDIVHLSWSHTGNELAVIDIGGRISTYAMMLSLNRLPAMKRISQDSEDNLGSVIGFMWLYIDRPERQEIFYKPMVKANNIWNFSCTPQKTSGPKAPRDRPGFASLTRMGRLKVMYHTMERWYEAKHDLQNVTEPCDILTHAGICPDKSGDKDGLLIVTHDVRRHIRLFRVKVDFEKMIIHAQTLCILDDFAPTDEDPDNFSVTNVKLARLSFLEIIASGPESKSRPQTQPFLLAGFSRLADDFQAGGEQLTVLSRWQIEAGKSKLHSNFGSQSQKNQSASSALLEEYTLNRLPDRQVSRTLLGIQQLNVSTVLVFIFSDGTVEFRDRNTMEILHSDQNEDQITNLPQIGFGFQGVRPCLHAALSPNATVLFALDEHHSPIMDLLQYNAPLDEHAMSDKFFERICEAFVLHFSWVSLTNWNYTEDLLYTLQIFSNQFLMDASVKGSLPVLTDRKGFHANLLSEIYRVMGIAVDHSTVNQPEQAFRTVFLQRCLNFQAGFGYVGEDFSRSLPASVAWTMLNLRYCTMAFTMALNKNTNPKFPPPPGAADMESKNPEVVHYLLGLVSWFMTLIAYMFDELFALSDHFSDLNALDTLDSDQLNEYLRTNASPSLPLLLASTARSMLRANCRYIGHLVAESKSILSPASGAQSQNPTAMLSRGYRELDLLLAKALVDLPKADRLLGSVDSLTKSSYNAAIAGSPKQKTSGVQVNGTDAFTAEDRSRIEREVLIGANIPDFLVQRVVKPLLTTTVDALKEEVDVAELYFADVGWLGLTKPSPPPPGSDMAFIAATRAKVKRRSRKNPIVDAMTKVVIRRTGPLVNPSANSGTTTTINTSTTTFANDGSKAPAPRLRRCIRCCALMEDIMPPRSAGMLLGMIYRDCFCGGRWILLDGTEDAGVVVGGAMDETMGDDDEEVEEGEAAAAAAAAAAAVTGTVNGGNVHNNNVIMGTVAKGVGVGVGVGIPMGVGNIPVNVTGNDGGIIDVNAAAAAVAAGAAGVTGDVVNVTGDDSMVL